MKTLRPCQTLVVGIALGLALIPTAPAAAPASHEDLKPFFSQYCVRCHGPEKQKGDFRVDTLKPAQSKEDAEKWQGVLKQLREGEMPPAKEKQPSATEAKAVMAWVDGELGRATKLLAGAARETVLRRLNRHEMENTLRDLFQLPALEVSDLIPADTKKHAFDNDGRALDLGSAHLDGYLLAIDAALAKAAAWDNKTGGIVASPYEKLVRNYGLIPQGIDEKKFDEQQARHGSKLDVVAPLPHARRTMYFNSFVFKPKSDGTYRIRLKHYLHKLDARLGDVVVRGSQPNSEIIPRTVDVFEAKPGSAESPHIYELELYLSAAEQVIITVNSPKREPGLPGWYQRFKNPKDAEKFFAKGRPDDEYQKALAIIAENKQMGCWAVMSEEVEGPLEHAQAWPPRSHTALYGAAKKRDAVTEADALAALRAFIPRAFRRPVGEAEMKPFLDLVSAEVRQHRTPPHAALAAGLRTVLTAPQFLYLNEAKGALDAHALASRLSYFLWSTMPDEALLKSAAAGQLRGDGLKAEVERMLNDTKARALEERFLTLWLDLDKFGDTTPDAVLYPEYTANLGQLMLQETKLFFRKMLRHDLSVMNVVDSGFTMLNEELARYYGIPGVRGYQFRKVALTPEHRRGGLITHGSVLKVTANGTETSPVLRGVWLLDRIFGDPVPPPPAAPPAITPDTRGAVTVREQLAKHRNDPSCFDCHRKIDPLGFALESYDPAGTFRTFYRTTGDAGKPVKAEVSRASRGGSTLRDGNTRPVTYRQGRDVETGGEMPGGKPFRDLTEFKTLLLSQERAVAENVVRQLLAYALGRELDFTDRAAIERILADTKPGHHGLRSLIHGVAQSPPFQTK